jgi:hypothetical protein
MKPNTLLKPLTAACLLSFAGTSFAASHSMPVGSNLSYGGASNPHTVHSISQNPAWVYSKLEGNHAFGIGLNGGISLQQDGANNVINTLDKTIDPLLDENSSLSAASRAVELEREFPKLIRDMRDSFYIQTEAQASTPLFYTNGKWGGFGIEMNVYGAFRGRILADDQVLLLTSPSIDPDNIIDSYTVNAALYTKTVAMAEFSLNYARTAYTHEKGSLVVGGRLKAMQGDLTKNVNNFSKYLQSDDDVSIDDEIDLPDLDNAQTQFALDLGVQWLADNWMLGSTLSNINTPTFDYNVLTSAESTKWSDQINPNEIVELEPQLRLEGAVFTKNRNWTFAASIDANEARDLLNNEYQWASASISYASRASQNWWYALIPDVRLGYRANLVGEKESFIAPGFTWGPVNLDIAVTSFGDISKAGNNADDDTVDLPKSFAVNFGLELSF